MKITLFIIVISILFSQSLLFGRTWELKSGTKVEATFDKIDGKFIYIKRSNGKLAKIEITKLVEKDQAYIKSKRLNGKLAKIVESNPTLPKKTKVTGAQAKLLGMWKHRTGKNTIQFRDDGTIHHKVIGSGNIETETLKGTWGMSKDGTLIMLFKKGENQEFIWYSRKFTGDLIDYKIKYPNNKNLRAKEMKRFLYRIK